MRADPLEREFSELRGLVWRPDAAALRARLEAMPAEAAKLQANRVSFGETLLGHAAAHCADCTGVLLDCGADPDLAGDRRPLMEAVRAGNAAAVQRLLEAGAAAEFCDDTDQCLTPLLVAVRRAETDTRIVELLLAAGANVAACAAGGATVFNFAARAGNPALVELLAEQPKAPAIDSRDKKDVRGTGLHYAIEDRNRKLVEAFLRAGADADARETETWFATDWGETMLHAAVAAEHLGIISLLVKHGAAVDRPDDFGATPLHAAALAGKARIVRRLLKHRADPNTRDKYGQTPLHYAVIKENAEMAGLMLARGADPNIRDAQGRTVLAAAARRGMADPLRRAGAEPDLVINCKPPGVPDAEAARWRARRG